MTLTLHVTLKIGQAKSTCTSYISQSLAVAVLFPLMKFYIVLLFRHGVHV